MSSFFEKLKTGMGLEEPEITEPFEQEKKTRPAKRSVAKQGKLSGVKKLR